MPKSEYFQGHGNEVLSSIRKAHPNYSKRRVDEEFYATANKQDSEVKKGMKSAMRKKKGKR